MKKMIIHINVATLEEKQLAITIGNIKISTYENAVDNRPLNIPKSENPILVDIAIDWIKNINLKKPSFQYFIGDTNNTKVNIATVLITGRVKIPTGSENFSDAE
ncbi:hypothetical protein OB954_14965 [Aeromonas salmonicida]|nr:hypothetical protein [Aeromonas salmonicida]MDM5128116.1 hypothetical protein [Aeromonas salmonicida]